MNAPAERALLDAGDADGAGRAALLADVVAGLSAPRKTLPCKYLYDAHGSRLFDRICELPEYYPTRTECGILRSYSGEIAAHAGPEATLVEFGSGSSIKIRLLLSALESLHVYTPIDISREHMLQAAAALQRDFPDLRVAPVCADYTRALALPGEHGPGRRVGFFPGSTIGNFTPVEAVGFLKRARTLLGRGALMVVGVDLPKAEAILQAAYDDAAGVTAEFNLNLLARINRELGGDFDLAAFRHRARWNGQLSRVEMHLESLVEQRVSLAGHDFSFEAGETIHTENSYKYGLDAFRRIACAAGWSGRTVWLDADTRFSVHLLEADEPAL